MSQPRPRGPWGTGTGSWPDAARSELGRARGHGAGPRRSPRTGVRSWTHRSISSKLLNSLCLHLIYVICGTDRTFHPASLGGNWERKFSRAHMAPGKESSARECSVNHGDSWRRAPTTGRMPGASGMTLLSGWPGNSCSGHFRSLCLRAHQRGPLLPLALPENCHVFKSGASPSQKPISMKTFGPQAPPCPS